MKKYLFSGLAFISSFTMAFFLAVAPAMAEGGPEPWQIYLQDAATPAAERVHDFHALLLWIITGIVIFVMLLLLVVMVRFNARANPKPAMFAHNTLVEIVWTVVPVVILLIIAVPSFKLLYYVDRVPPNPDMTIKAIASQWYWTYEYPDHGGISFTANMIPDKDIDPSKGQKRLLSTDNVLVVPVNTTVQVLVTATDVIHSFAMPSFGIKKDAVPGRLNETWFRVEKPGVYYGQCSELCGKDHAYMPIEIHVVSKEEFDAWVEEAKQKFSANDADFDARPVKLAQR